LKPKLIDVTLREGHQAADVYITAKQRRGILKGLAAIGVDEIEIGPAAEDGDLAATVAEARSLAPNARIAVWCRAFGPDVELAMDAEPDVLSVSIPASDIQLESKMARCRDWALKQVHRIGRLVRDSKPIYLSLGIEDATRSNANFLDDLVCMACDAGFDRVRIADTIGIATPASVFNTVRRLLDNNTVSLGIHAHNDFGMATANAIAAIQAGAGSISATVTGLGERAGNAVLEQVAMAMRHSLGLESGIDCSALPALCEQVAQASKRVIPANQPITGEAIFQHESGIHCHSLLQDRNSFEPFSASELGKITPDFVIGRHSGSESVLQVLSGLGVNTTRSIADRMLPKIRECSVLKKSALSHDDLLRIYRGTTGAPGRGEVSQPRTGTSG